MQIQRFTDARESVRFFAAPVLANAEKDQKEDRLVRLAFSSETPLLREFEFGPAWEVLGHSPGEIRLERINSGSAPLLKEHKRDVDAMVGTVVSTTIESGRGRALVRFADSKSGNEMLERVLDGEVKNVSVGYRTHNFQKVGDHDGVPVLRATDWEPFEISLVAAPADLNTGIGRSLPLSAHNSITKGNDMKTDIENGSILDERTRASDITELGRQHQMSERTIGNAISQGTTVADFQRQILEKLGSDETTLTRASLAAPSIGSGEKPYSLTRAISAELSGNWQEAGFERELNQELRRITGRAPNGIYVPTMALAGRAVITTATAPTLIGTSHMSEAFIDVLKPEVQVINLGATVLPGLVENVSIPRMAAGTAAEWIGEDAEASESNPVFDNVTLTLKQLSARSRMSRRQLKQSLPGLDMILANDLRQQIAVALDKAAINGSGSGDEPAGVLNMPGIGIHPMGDDGGPLLWSGVTSLMSLVEAANVSPAALGFLTNYKVKSSMMSTPKVSGTDSMILSPEVAEPVLGGYKVAFSSNVPDNGTKGPGTDLSSLIFGNWADLLIGQWGGVDLIVDDVTEAGKGNVRIVAHSEWDIAVRHAESFSAIVDIEAS